MTATNGETARHCAGKLVVAATGATDLHVSCDACAFHVASPMACVTLDELDALQVRHDREAMPDVVALADAWQETLWGQQQPWDALLAQALEQVMNHADDGSEQ